MIGDLIAELFEIETKMKKVLYCPVGRTWDSPDAQPILKHHKMEMSRLERRKKAIIKTLNKVG